MAQCVNYKKKRLVFTFANISNKQNVIDASDPALCLILRQGEFYSLLAEFEADRCEVECHSVEQVASSQQVLGSIQATLFPTAWGSVGIM